MTKKTRPTFDRHRELGLELKNVELYLVKLQAELGKAYPKGSGVNRAVNRATKALGDLRFALSDEIEHERWRSWKENLYHVYYFWEAQGAALASVNTIDDELLSVWYAMLGEEFRGTSKDDILCAFQGLKPRRKIILATRFNLAGRSEKPATKEELGKVFGVPRERITQLERFALRDMRNALRGENDEKEG